MDILIEPSEESELLYDGAADDSRFLRLLADVVEDETAVLAELGQ